MGSILFDFLTESVLFDSEHLEDEFRNLPDIDLAAALQRYREFCLSHQEDLVAEAVGSKQDSRVFPGTHSVDATLLRQSALYIERYVLSDPLFPLTEQEKSYGLAMRSYLGHDAPHRLDRVSLAKVIAKLKKLTPMIAADYVKLIPASYLFETPDQLPMYYSENNFSEVLPPELLSFFQLHKTVAVLRRDKTGWIEDPGARRSRSIAVEFGDDYSAGMVYQLFEQEIEEVNEATRTYTGRLWVPDSLPAQRNYDVWIDQSVNRTAINYYERLCKEMALSIRLGCSYLCFSEFRSDLLSRFFPVKVGTSEHTANVVLRVDVPFLDEIDSETLMKIRRDEGEAFQVFRHELEQQFWVFRMEEDPEKLRIKAEKTMHELGTVQHDLLTTKLKELRRGALTSTVILSATLAGTFMASSHYLPALIGAGIGGAYKLKSDYDAALRQNPSFFLWKARRSSRGV